MKWSHVRGVGGCPAENGWCCIGLQNNSREALEK